MIITQPERVYLAQEVASFAHHLGGDILDVGGGDGRRYKNLFQFRTYRTLDVAGSPDILASSDAIPLPDESVDSILCAQMIQAVINPQDHLREMARVLKCGGKMILTYPQTLPMHPSNCLMFTLSGTTRLCEHAGLRVLSVSQRGQYPSALAQLRIRRWVDLCRPYETPSMWVLGPLSLVYTRVAMFMDRFHRSPMFALGWTLLLERKA